MVVSIASLVYECVSFTSAFGLRAGRQLGRSQGLKLSSPSAQRNRGPIAAVLADWLPESGLVLEVASGSGEHAVHFAQAFPQLDWQPSDPDPSAITSIEAWRADSGLRNLREPIILDAASDRWPVEEADAVLNINMVHISPWQAALGLLDGAARILAAGGKLILYGPWTLERFPTAPSNLAFDADLKSRNAAWGLRKVEDFAAEAENRCLSLADQREMPANNRMLLFIRR
jgi:SAM-dependent methyltransferase